MLSVRPSFVAGATLVEGPLSCHKSPGPVGNLEFWWLVCPAEKRKNDNKRVRVHAHRSATPESMRKAINVSATDVSTCRLQGSLCSSTGRLAWMLCKSSTCAFVPWLSFAAMHGRPCEDGRPTSS